MYQWLYNFKDKEKEFILSHFVLFCPLIYLACSFCNSTLNKYSTYMTADT